MMDMLGVAGHSLFVIEHTSHLDDTSSSSQLMFLQECPVTSVTQVDIRARPPRLGIAFTSVD